MLVGKELEMYQVQGKNVQIARNYICLFDYLFISS